MSSLYSFPNLKSSETIKDFSGGTGYADGMELKLRILRAREAAGLTQQNLADAVGVTRGAVAQWESGEIRPRHKTLTKVAKATGKDIAWLESGIDGANIGLWCVGEVAAGAWKEASAMLEPYPLPVAPHPGYPAHSQRLYKVSGNSINRHVRDGEYIHCVDIIAADERPVNGDLVVVRRSEHGMAEYSVKRYIRSGGRVFLRPESDDPKFQDDLVLDGDEATEIAVTDIVIALWRPFARGSS